MSELHRLLDRFATLHRQHVEIEQEISAVESEICALNGSQRPRRPRPTPAEVDDQVLTVIRTLQEANEPIPPSEIAARMGAAPIQAIQRLRQAVSLGFVQKVGGGRYTVATEVPAL